MKLHLIQLINLFFLLYFIINFINLPKSLCQKIEGGSSNNQSINSRGCNANFRCQTGSSTVKSPPPPPTNSRGCNANFRCQTGSSTVKSPPPPPTNSRGCSNTSRCQTGSSTVNSPPPPPTNSRGCNNTSRCQTGSSTVKSPPPPPLVPAVITSPPQNSTLNVTRSATANKNLTAAPTPTSSTVPDAASTYHAHGNVKFKFAIAASIVGIIVVATMVVIISCLRKKFFSDIYFFWKKKTENSQSMEIFLKNHASLIQKRYQYSDVKKMTNSFKDKLGQGAYGSVFRGKLFDGRMVAVKLLRESKGNGEEFINEVASISRTSHINIVSLLDFCVESSKRALIYDFMPNGSLEKFIYDEKPLQKHHYLEWETLYKIAVGIARGLEYLHRGCNTRILHFDIKPHNILLDQDFCPKISDFGLAKLCFKKESVVSMIGARGTPGYIAPELIYKNFGRVSYKSDVYSYGMMLLEMVGGRKNIDPGVENISEIYFPHWIHKRLDTCSDLGLRGVTTTKDEEIARKMILVGLWCIQMDPSCRPAMNRVLEMLEGSLEALQIPPMSLFTSPSRSPEASSTKSTL